MPAPLVPVPPPPALSSSSSSSPQGLTLERILGQTPPRTSAFSVHPSSGLVAYPCGSVVVLYSPTSNRQTRFFRASQPIASLAFSPCGRYLAVGERGGPSPAIIVWSLDSGRVESELKGHKHGIGALAFGGGRGSNILVSAGFSSDARLYIWNWRGQTPIAAARLNGGAKVHAVRFMRGGQSTRFVTVGERHVKFWTLDAGNVTFPDEPAGGAGVSDDKARRRLLNPSDDGDVGENDDDDANEVSLLDRKAERGPLPEIRGFPASILSSVEDSTFVDVDFDTPWTTTTTTTTTNEHPDSTAHAQPPPPTSPPTTVFALTSLGVLCAFDPETYQMKNWVDLNSPSSHSLSVSPCGSQLAVGCGNGLVRVFDVPTLKYKGTIKSGSMSEARCVRFLPPPCAAAPAAAGGKPIVGLATPTNTPRVTTTTTTLDLAVVYGDCSYRHYTNVEHLQGTASPLPTSASSSYSSFPADSSSSSSSSSAAIVTTVRSFQCHRSPITALAMVPQCGSGGGGLLFPKGTFATAGEDGTVRFWNLGGKQLRRAPPSSKSKGSSSSSSSSSAPADLPLAGDAADVQLRAFPVAAAEASAASLTRPTAETAADNKDKAKAQRVADAAAELDPFQQCQGIRPLGFPTALAVHPSGRSFATGDSLGNVRVFDVSSPTIPLTDVIAAHDDAITSLSFLDPSTLSPAPPAAKPLLASGSRDGLVHVFDASPPTGPYSRVASLSPHASSASSSASSAGVCAVSFRPSRAAAQFVSCNAEGSLSLCSVDASKGTGGGERLRFAASAGNGNGNSVVAAAAGGIALEPGGKFLASAGSDAKLNIYNVETLKLVRTYKTDERVPLAAAKADDNSSTTNSQPHSHKVDFDPSGLFVAACGSDKWIRLFDFYSGECIAKVAGHGASITGLKFTQDGRRLVSTGRDGGIFVWRLAPDLIAAMQDRLKEVDLKAQPAVAAAAAAAPAAQIIPAFAAAAAMSPDRVVKASSVPTWAKTTKVAEQSSSTTATASSTTNPPPAPLKGAWSQRASAAPPVVTVSTAASTVVDRYDESDPNCDVPPPPPSPPSDEDNGGEPQYEEDFEAEGSPVKAAVEGSEPKVYASLALSSIDVEGSKLNFDEVFRQRRVGDDASDPLTRAREDEDVMMFGDGDDVNDSVYKEFVDSVANSLKAGGTPVAAGDYAVMRASMSKDFRELQQAAPVVVEEREPESVVDAAGDDEQDEYEDDDDDDENEISLQNLEKSLDAPERSLKQERKKLKLVEKKKQTAEAVFAMRSKLKEMGFLTSQEIDPSTIRLSGVGGTASLGDEEVRPATSAGHSADNSRVKLERAPEPERPHTAQPSVPSLVVDVSEAAAAQNDDEKNNQFFLSPAETNTSLDSSSLLGLSYTMTGKLNLDGGYASDASAPVASDKERSSIESLSVKVVVGAASAGTAGEATNQQVPTGSSNPRPSISPFGGSQQHAVKVMEEQVKEVQGAAQQQQQQQHVSQRRPATAPVSSGGVGGPSTSFSSSASIQLKRPTAVYRDSLAELNRAMKNAVDLYSELLEASQQLPADTSLNESAVQNTTTFADSESTELLNSFRDSFASLQGKMAMAFTVQGGENTFMPSILEDSTSSWGMPRPLVSQSVSSKVFEAHSGGGVGKGHMMMMGGVQQQQRPMTAGGALGSSEGSFSGTSSAGNDAMLLDSVLEKYADLIFAKVEKKLSSSTTAFDPSSSIGK